MIYNPKDNDVNSKMTNTNKLLFGYLLDKDLWQLVKIQNLKSKDGKQNKKRIHDK